LAACERAATLLKEESELKAGRRIGAYEIVSLLGCGGMGEVYLAHDTKLGRKVALKLLPASFTRATDRFRRFEREARAASALNHPNILTIHEIGESDSVHFIATEFVEGETLRQRLSHTKLNVVETLHIATQIADALEAAHKEGIIHRDIKPENIMLRRDGYVKVLDFGLAKLVERQPPLVDSQAPTQPQFNTSPGLVIGTAQYMSPEQARGLRVDARTDIWSLGVVLYEMVAGRAPFVGKTSSDVIVSVLDREPPPLTSRAAGETIPPKLEWIIEKALRKDPEVRYQTIAELRGDLLSLKQQLERESKPERPTPPTKGWLIALAVILTLAVGLFPDNEDQQADECRQGDRCGHFARRQICHLRSGRCRTPEPLAAPRPHQQRQGDHCARGVKLPGTDLFARWQLHLLHRFKRRYDQ
jgi:serine/threonine protein kinase